jgi:hypothetical protein
VNGSFLSKQRTHTFGHHLPLRILPHSRLSIQAALQTRHSIGTIDLAGLDFGYAAVAVIGLANFHFSRRPQVAVEVFARKKLFPAI